MTAVTRRSVWGGILLAAVIAAVPLQASDPVGIYAVVDRVVVTPGNTGSTVQIWGTFALAITPPSRSYQPEEAYGKPRKGYLLFSCPAEKAATCQAEWNDLRSVAGKGDVVGFGMRWSTAPLVRQAGEAAGAPDPYAFNVGVVKLGKYGDYPSIAAALKALSSTK